MVDSAVVVLEAGGRNDQDGFAGQDVVAVEGLGHGDHLAGGDGDIDGGDLQAAFDDGGIDMAFGAGIAGDDDGRRGLRGDDERINLLFHIRIEWNLPQAKPPLEQDIGGRGEDRDGDRGREEDFQPGSIADHGAGP